MKPINADRTCQKNVIVLFLMPVTYPKPNDSTNDDFALIGSKLGRKFLVFFMHIELPQFT